MTRHLIISAAAMLAVLPAAGEQPEMSPVQGEEQLAATEGEFRNVWVHPDADLAEYEKLYAWEPAFHFREVEESPAIRSTTQMLSGRNQGPYSLEPEARERFESIVSEALLEQLRRSKEFELVDQIGPDTLIVRGAFVDIVSSVPPESASRLRMHLADVGEATFVCELIDAETGVIQARISERREIRPPSRMNRVSDMPATRATIWNDVRIWAVDLAVDLRRQLERARKQAES